MALCRRGATGRAGMGRPFAFLVFPKKNGPGGGPGPSASLLNVLRQTCAASLSTCRPCSPGPWLRPFRQPSGRPCRHRRPCCMRSGSPSKTWPAASREIKRFIEFSFAQGTNRVAVCSPHAHETHLAVKLVWNSGNMSALAFNRSARSGEGESEARSAQRVECACLTRPASGLATRGVPVNRASASTFRTGFRPDPRRATQWHCAYPAPD